MLSPSERRTQSQPRRCTPDARRNSRRGEMGVPSPENPGSTVGGEPSRRPAQPPQTRSARGWPTYGAPNRPWRRVFGTQNERLRSTISPKTGPYPCRNNGLSWSDPAVHHYRSANSSPCRASRGLASPSECALPGAPKKGCPEGHPRFLLYEVLRSYDERQHQIESRRQPHRRCCSLRRHTTHSRRPRSAC